MAMSFNTALSGLSASSTDLSVIGNNISNANTVGFKFSRTEFADLYSASLRTYSGARVGTGVKVSGVVQQFTQGNANTTDQALDLTISGDGFFRVTDEGDLNPLYTRNGAFHIDKNNDIVNTQGQYLSAFQADAKTGQILGTRGKINVDQSDIAPASTTEMSAIINLNSGEVAPKATTKIDLSGLRLNATDIAPATEFDPQNTSTYNSQVSTTIYDAQGVAHDAMIYFRKSGTEANVWEVHTTVEGINGFSGAMEIFPAGFDSTNPMTITFDANTGEFVSTVPPQAIFNTFIVPPDSSGLVVPDQNNPLSFIITGLDGATQTAGIKWKATIAGETLTDLGTALSATPAIDPTVDMPLGVFDPADETTYDVADTGFLISDSSGIEHQVRRYFISDGPGSYSWSMHTIIADADGTNPVEVFYDPNNPSAVKVIANADGTLSTKPENFEFTFDPSGVTADGAMNRSEIMKLSFPALQNYPDAVPKVVVDGNAAKVWRSPESGAIPDPDTYNYTTSATIYDSQGGSHLAAFYYVKVGENTWDMHTFVDNQELNVSQNGLNGAGSPVRLTFDNNGVLAKKESAPLPPVYDDNGQVISQRTLPKSISGPIPLTAVLQNGAAEINFAMDIDRITQYGSPSGVASLTQDGYPTGHISSINVDSEGRISSYFTNGKSRTLGQIVMVNFTNIQGLRPVGNTQWAETSTSGEPLLVRPGEAGTGGVQSGALESSNVDLTKQLVDMIVAQRTFQANAQVVSAVDTLTQAVINLR